jgi:glutamate/tyrosine decarboxylase-like PLP-dependent enzyme
MLDPSPDEIRRWGSHAIDAMADYFASIRSRRVYPDTTSAAIRQTLGSKLPDEPADFDNLLTTFRDIVELSRHNGHPRMFGYVQAPGTALAAFADLLASTLNANLTAWRSAPAAVELERLTIDWIKQLLRYDTNAAGLFVSGGSMANFAALAAAYRAKAPVDLLRQGARSLARTMRVYASQETHYSVEKAAALLGLGRENVRKIAVDEHYNIRLDELGRGRILRLKDKQFN